VVDLRFCQLKLTFVLALPKCGPEEEDQMRR
jgi:hypothetical protein